MRTAASNANSWRSRISALPRLLVVLLEREHTERDVARFVAHHVAEQLLEQRLGGHLVHEPERREREALDHDLHAEVGHVPAGVGDDVVEQHLEVRVDRVVTRQLRVEVPGEHLDVAGLVHHLRRRVVLGVDPRHRLDDLRGADQRALLAVHELRQRPVLRLDAELGSTPCRPRSRTACPVRSRSAVEAVLVGLVRLRDLLLVDVDRPTGGRWRSTATSSPSRRA